MAKTVLITGGAVRIGREIALSLADTGWDVAIHYNSSKKPADELAALIRKKKRKAYPVKADLCNVEEVASVIPSLNKKGIRIDCLINNAAVFEKDNIYNFELEGWRKHIEINLFAPLRLMREFAAQYDGKDGNIINITDGMNGWSMSGAFLSYSVSKAGLENATLLLAKELAPAIRINAIAPGPTIEGKQDKEDTFNKLSKIIPLRRTSSPQEICDTVQYILSAPSVTGQIISLSGGV